MKKDRGQAREPANAGGQDRNFRLTDVLGAFWRPGAEALSILGGNSRPGGARQGNTGSGIMPPAPKEPEEEKE